MNEEIERIASFVGLERDLKKMAKNLSGGMKRRLMVAMALIGDSKIIILGKRRKFSSNLILILLINVPRSVKMSQLRVLTHLTESSCGS